MLLARYHDTLVRSAAIRATTPERLTFGAGNLLSLTARSTKHSNGLAGLSRFTWERVRMAYVAQVEAEMEGILCKVKRYCDRGL